MSMSCNAALEMNLVSGTMVTDRIRLERLLGEGGMGAVWVAEHLKLGARVAVKFISAELSTKHPELHERFLREAAAAAKIASPHVVRTYDFGAMEDGTPFLVMELLEGESLADRLRRQKALPPAEVALIISQVAKALSEAHRLGVVHRDIKPGNIFLTQSGRDLFAKVLDFGIAKDTETAMGNATKTGFALGTPSYMSPEQLMSAKAVDAQADLWALAVTAYELLTGSQPFVGETVPHLILSIHTGKFDAPSSLRHPPTVGDSTALDAFFARAFSADKAKRFASALDFADALSLACGVRLDAPSSSVFVPPPSGVAVPGITEHPQTAIRPIERSPFVPAPITSLSAQRIEPVAPRRQPPLLLGAIAVLVLGAGAVAFVATRGKARTAEVDEPTPTATDPTPDPTADATDRSAPAPVTSTALVPVGNRVISVPEGLSEAAGNAWIPAFTARVSPTPLTSLASAFGACRAQDKVLCSESQWKAACAVDPSIASTRAWTGAFEGGKGIVRGGATCADRQPTASGASGVGAVCCDQAVAVTVEGEELQRLTSARLTDYQVLMNASRADKLASDFYAPTVVFLNQERERDTLKKLAKTYFEANPDQGQIYNLCKVVVGGGEWQATCSTILFHGGKTFGLDQKLAFNRGPNKLLRVGEENVSKIP